MDAPADTLILFAHGARDPEWRVPVDALARRMRALMPALRVDVAFLEFMSPTLPQTIEAVARQGARRVAVAPLFWAEGGHLKREVPELLAAAAKHHPTLEFERWPVLGDSPEVLAALAGVYCQRLGRAGS